MPDVSVTSIVREPAVSHWIVIAFDVEPDTIVRSVAVPLTVQAYVLPTFCVVEYVFVSFEHTVRSPVITGAGSCVTATLSVDVAEQRPVAFDSVTEIVCAPVFVQRTATLFVVAPLWIVPPVIVQLYTAPALFVTLYV